MAASDYGPWEFWPGPLDENGQAPADCSAFDRMYKISIDDLIAYESGETDINPDFLEWPAHLGAPVIDGDGILDNYNLEAGDRPKILGHQNVWWIMNDQGNEHGWARTVPLEMEVRTTAFSIRNADHLDNTTFYKYELKNRSDKDIEEFFFGLWADTDIGSFNDDYIGSDSLLGLGYAWNGSDFDAGIGGYGDRPPALGIDFVDGPIEDGSEINGTDSGGIDIPAKKLQMTNYHVYWGGGDLQGNPASAIDAYRYLQSLWRDGAPVTYGGSGRGFSDQATRWSFSGEPGEYWSEENRDDMGTRNAPADRRFLTSMGPMFIEPDETKTIIVAILWTQGEDRFDSVRLLKEASRYVQSGIDAGVHEDPSFLYRFNPRPKQGPNIPERMSIGTPYPNPTTGSINISYDLSGPTDVDISLFDLHGRKVRTFLAASEDAGAKKKTFSLTA